MFADGFVNDIITDFTNNLDSRDFIFGAIVVAEDLEKISGADKASAAEDITVSDKPVTK